jgi:CheY-like chemotaxis protein
MLDSLSFVYVEDEPFSRTVMEVLMKRRLGYQNITIFEDSDRFLDRLESLATTPDVVFLDIHMHPYTGFELLEMLRQDQRYINTKVIALTASVMNEEVELLQKAGFDGGLSKPLDQQLFPELLQKILDGEAVWYIG